MKNFFEARFVPFLGIIALVAVIGFSMAACGDDNNDPPGPGPGGASTGLTIENIPSNITGYVSGMMVWGAPPILLVANDSLPEYPNVAARKSAAITGGKATLNAFVSNDLKYPKFTGTVSYNSISSSEDGGNDFMIIVASTDAWKASTGSPDPVTGVYKLKSGKTLQFTNGKATLNWNDLEEE
ncbi:MAG: hypothetical protein LBH20_09415 [Treponema sp.]|jgi:hypothetical protein|nr:hypothetical protein [Treponema sp.]